MFQYSNKYIFLWTLSDHFHEGVDNYAINAVNISDRVDVNGRTAHGTLDPSITSKRTQKGKTEVKTKNIFPLWTQRLIR